MNESKIVAIITGITVIILVAAFAIYLTKNKQAQAVTIADFSVWNQEELPPLLQELPETITASIHTYHGQETWIKISHTGDETVSIPIFEAAAQDIDNCRLDYIAYMKVEDVKEKAYLEMLCFLDGKPYFSRGLKHSLSGTTKDYRLIIPFFLKQGEKLEKLHLGVRIEGPGSVWIRGMNVDKYNSSVFTSISFIQYGWLGAFLGIMGGVYGCTAGYCVPRGKGKAFLNGLGYFIIMFCAVSLVLGILALASGEQYGIWYSLIHTGLLGLVIFIPIHFMTLRNYQKLELQRMKAMDSLDSVS